MARRGWAEPDRQPYGSTEEYLENEKRRHQDELVEHKVRRPEVEVERARERAEAARRGVAPPQIDTTRSDQTGRLQMGSLALLDDAAEGRNSQAIALGRDQAYQAGLAQRSMAASVRGGAMARAAAARAAQAGVARTGAQIMQGAEAARANEMAAARAAHANLAQNIRGQELGIASTRAQMEMGERERAERKAQEYEKMGFERRSTQAMRNVGEEARLQEDIAKINERSERERALNSEKAQQAAMVALAAGAAVSDARAKTKPIPVGSLARLWRDD